MRNFNRPSRPPPRDYLKAMRLVAAGFSTVGKTLTQPGVSARHAIRKKIGKEYGVFGGKLAMSGKRVGKLVGVGKHMSTLGRKILRQRVENLDSPGERRELRGVVASELIEARPRLVKELGEYEAEKIMRRFGLGKGQKAENSPLKGGRSVPGEKAEKWAKEVILGERGELAAAILGGYDRPHEVVLSKKLTTQEEVADLAARERAKGALKERDIAGFEESLGVDESVSGQTQQPSGPAHRSTWKVSPRTGWGRRSSGGEK